jgi:hypothetical protein
VPATDWRGGLLPAGRLGPARYLPLLAPSTNERDTDSPCYCRLQEWQLRR